MTTGQRVAVLGAGPSGLATIKSLLEEGHTPVCYERAGDLGGVFRFSEDDGVIWEHCRLTSSGMLTAFSDFPVLPEEREHMLAAQYAGYLRRYAEAFDLTRCITFGAVVSSVAPSERGGWMVRVDGLAGGTREEHFDAVAICCGLNQTPHLPRLPGQDEFPGTVLHASAYRRATPMAGARVLVVGGGESAADIVADVSPVAAEVVLSLRRGVAIVPRRRFGAPTDFTLARLNHSAASWVAHTRSPADDWKRRVYATAFLPFVLVDRAARWWATFAHDVMPLVHPRRLFGGRAGRAAMASGLATRRVVAELLRESGGTVMEQFGTKTEGFAEALAAGRCRRVGAPVRFEGRQVRFDDGSSYAPDVVIFCTGFENRMPFLDSSLSAPPRYLHTFNPSVGATLAFIGMARPAHGAIPPVAELQSRWFALLLSGLRSLPSVRDMAERAEGLVAWRQQHYRAVRGRIDHMVDFTSFCDALAEQVGCKPTWRDIRRESAAFRLRFFASAFVSAQYRLAGPHANPRLAREVIGTLPVTHPAPTLVALYLRWVGCRVLRRLLGPEFAPKLELG